MAESHSNTTRDSVDWRDFMPKGSSTPIEGPNSDEISTLICVDLLDESPCLVADSPSSAPASLCSFNVSHPLLDESSLTFTSPSSEPQSLTPLTNKEMEDAIAERLSRFLVTTKCDQIGNQPILVSPSVSYDKLFNYYKYVAEFLVGPDFFDEELPQGGKHPPHKRLEEVLTMAQCDVPFVASDLMDGAYKIGQSSWRRFLAPLNWLCKTVDDLGLHNWMIKLKMEKEGKRSFEEELEAEDSQLDKEIEEAERKLRITAEKIKAGKKENIKLAEHLESLKIIFAVEEQACSKAEETLGIIITAKDRLVAKLAETEKKFEDIEKRANDLEMLNEALNNLLLKPKELGDDSEESISGTFFTM